MLQWRRAMPVGFLAVFVSVVAAAQVRHFHRPAGPRSGLITIFGANPAGATQLGRLDGSLRGIVGAMTQANALTAQTLRNLNPAVRVRVAPPSITPEVLVDVVAGADPATTQLLLESIGMRSVARAANLIGGWLPVTALAQAAQLPGLIQVRASMPRTRAAAGPVALQGDFVQSSSAVRAQYPGLTGKGVTVGVLSDSFNCYNYYAAHGPTPLGNGYNGTPPIPLRRLRPMMSPAARCPPVWMWWRRPIAVTMAHHSCDPTATKVVRWRRSFTSWRPARSWPFTRQSIPRRISPPASPSCSSSAQPSSWMMSAIRMSLSSRTAWWRRPSTRRQLTESRIFSAAGNDWRNSYETTTPVFVTQGSRSLLNFDTSGATTTTTLPITIPPVAPGEFVVLSVQWDQPFVTGAPGSPGAANTLNFCIESASPGADWVAQDTGQAQLVSYPVCTSANAVGADPLLLLAVGNPASATAPTPQETLTLAIQLVSGAAPGRVKFLLSDNGLGASIDSFATLSPTIQGHPNAAGAVAVAAALYYQTPALRHLPRGTGAFLLLRR